MFDEYFEATNEKFIQKFKDKSKNEVVTEFAALRSKTSNFYIDYDKRSLKKAKTLEAFAIRHIKHGEYNNISVNGNKIEHKINKIDVKNQYTLNFCYKYFIIYVC